MTEQTETIEPIEEPGFTPRELREPDSQAMATTGAHDMATAGPVTPSDLLQIAMNKGADLDRLEKLMDLQERYEAKQAQKAFAAALADFHRDPPTIVKDSHVCYRNNKGGTTEYDHPTLAHNNSIIARALAVHGLSHRWNIQQHEDGLIQVTCILSHRDGHEEHVSQYANADDSGGKNRIQAVGSTTEYLRRYTLFAITGLAASGMHEDDGRASSAAPQTLDADQQAELKKLMREAKADEAILLDYFGAESIGTINADDYPKAALMLRTKIKQQREAAEHNKEGAK